MKYLKFLVPLAMLVLLLTLAVPAFADDPFGATIPSKTSGNGSTTWAAKYIGDNGCFTGKLPAGSAMWFKGDAWIDKPQLIWLDDELPNATKPSGWSVLGVPLQYEKGSAPDSAKRQGALGFYYDNFMQGFAFQVWAPPDDLQPNFAYPGPNNGWILTDAQGMPNPGSCGQTQIGGPSGGCPVGWGAWNKPFASGARNPLNAYMNSGGTPPTHLLWYRGDWAGWYYVKVYNQMLIDGWFTICTLRNTES